MTDKTERQEGNLLERGLPCIGCSSSDAFCLYKKPDGTIDGTCYSCGNYFFPDQVSKAIDTEDYANMKGKPPVEPISPEKLEEIRSKPMRGWKERKIKRTTCERFEVYTDMDADGKVTHRYYPNYEDGVCVGFQVRDDKVKQAKKAGEEVNRPPFYALGKVKASCQMFGQDKFPKGGKFLVVTGGSEDAMAVYQALRSDKYETACVSPLVGEGSAYKQIQNNYEYCASFEKIIVMMDNDKVGREGAAKISKMFGHGRVHVADLTYKDPCEYLKYPDGEIKLKKAFWEAMPKKPSQVLTVSDIREKAMKMPEEGLSFPWPSATKATGGIRRGEIHIVGAAPKIGKTEHQHQLIKHCTDVHKEKVGVMSLEENPVKTLKKIGGKYAGKQFTKPPEVGGYTMDDMNAAYDLLEEKMEFYSSDGVRDYEEILETVRYWASKGIWLFIIDPLTALVAEHSSSEANDILNKFMSKVASMAMELQISFFLYSHVNPVKSGTPHDAGGDVLSSQFTGSRAMEKWAHYGWGIQRNRTEKDARKRNVARITMLFDREFGEWCEYYAFYDHAINDWSEVTQEGEEATDDEFAMLANEFPEGYSVQETEGAPWDEGTSEEVERDF